jgi:small GTP-binding protein
MKEKNNAGLEEAKRRIKEAKEKELSRLDLSRLGLTGIPGEVFELTGLKRLYLKGNQLTELPREIAELNYLDYLGLSYNQLTKLPKEIVELKDLRILTLSYNQFTQLPKEITESKNLRYLYLSNNQLTQLPKEIGELKKLRYLFLNHNQLTQLPKEIAKLKNLLRLILHNNHLTQFPKDIAELKKLGQLSLSYNQLTRLPKEIAELKKLEELKLDDNQLTHLPKEMAQLENLQTLTLDGNKNLISPPPAVVKQGLSAIFKYLKALEEKTTVWASKMVLVGEGGVGKTCLLDALEGKEFVPGKDTTHGIDTRKLNLPCPGRPDISMELNVWDFGGQEIYHATHQFYLTNHALFILVWSARLGYEAGKIYKWLETIEALAPDSPILIVATHCKERGADLPKGDIQNKFPGKVHFFEVDNENKQGIPQIMEAICEFASQLKYMGIERPLSWTKAASAIKELDKKYLSKNQLMEIFKASGVDEENFETLAVYLHEMGDILYYPEEEELKDTIIIKPAWVSQHMARVLDSEEISRNAGFLHKDLLQKLWQNLESPLHDIFITLMEKFDLSYKTENNVEISLVVEKLKYEEHPKYKEVWDNFQPSEREIVFKYELETIPAGIPTWFIARTHRYSMYIHWRNGALLQDKEKKHLALVMASPESKEVWLKVKGIMPYYFFALLRDTLELTFNRFEGLKRTARVPCPGHNNNPCSHLFNLEHLERKLTKTPPKFTIECPMATEDEDVEIMKMLFGLSYAPGNLVLVEEITGRMKQTIDDQTQLLVKEMQTKNMELIKFIQLEFFKSYQIQQKIMDQTCPNLFTLKPKDAKFYKKKLDVDEFEIQLYCQHPGKIHPVPEGKYTVKIPKKWLRAIAPYYTKMLKIMKWVLPIVQPAAKEILDEKVLKEMEFSIGLIKNYAKMMPEIKPGETDMDLEEKSHGEIYTASESELRLLREILGKKDTGSHWGGLDRVVTPGGHILWLCKEHAKEYE